MSDAVMGTIIICIIPLAVILLFIFIRKTNRDYTGEKNLKVLGKKATKKALKNANTKITCDSCGRTFDGKDNKVCPFCGAAFDNDKEWIASKYVDPKLQDKYFKDYVEDAKASAKYKNKWKWKLLSILMGILIFVATLVILNEKGYMFGRQKSDKIPSTYYVTDYGFIDNTILIDDENVRVELTNIYQEDYLYIIPVAITNKVKNAYTHVSFDVSTLNDVEINEFFYEGIKGNKTITRNLRINAYLYDVQDINRIIIDRIRYYTNNGESESLDGEFFEIKTSANTSDNHSIDLSSNRLIYEDIENGIEIYISDLDFYIIICNTSSNNYSYSVSEGKINGKYRDGIDFSGELYNNSMMSNKIGYLLDNSTYSSDYEEIDNFNISMVFVNMEDGDIIKVDNLYVEM